MSKKWPLSVLFIIVTFLFFSCEQEQEAVTSENYQYTVMSVQLYESSRPLDFVDANGKYSENFWGDKFDIDVEITNRAKTVSFKDINLRVIYYSKTKTVIDTKDYVLYEVAPPQKTTKFEMKVDNFKDVNTIGLEVIDATGSF